MRSLGYLAMIGFTIAGSFWLEVLLKVRVLRKLRRLALSIFPISLLFLLWDSYAISNGHWRFDREQILGIIGWAGIPIEEFLFFIFVPIAAIMTIEAVSSVMKLWKVGDEK